ncbi:energy transducer TonB [Sinomicrobium weinanense]|uniref:Energy transducer TonB n=1 Tax=Sinomicrobium weinanense TaxID=2842200 RepID=A0A926Q0L7_9FLAO|nr:energy transducer TonB [Sinomicrobium weinanense]MBC9795037.1 energy transducer TonB [Sinomicrobium weinanense]MBU3123834.1 energy transducer TonB [Sinomicrobium weinanense]
MIPKKNPKADLVRNSGLFFALGLALVLFLSWKGLEWKKYDKTSFIAQGSEADDIPDEINVPVIDLNTPPPPPPPSPDVIPPDFEPEDNDTEKEESRIFPTEDLFDEPIDVDDIPETETVSDEPVSINLVESVPVFPGCEDAEDKLKCFQESMIRHVQKNFSYPEWARERGVEGKVYVTFIIDKDGNITGVNMRGPDKSLEKEAARIIDKLPKMTPGKQGNRAVRVPFSLPITFRLK